MQYFCCGWALGPAWNGIDPMAMRQFFKAHLNGRTYFRGTMTGKTFACCEMKGGPSWRSATAPGAAPAVAITESEYNSLRALQIERVKAAGKNPAHCVSPFEAWVIGEV